MVTIYADGSLIYHPERDDLPLYNISLTLEDSVADQLSFSITESHPYFSSLRKLATQIIVRRADRILFKGRVIDDQSDIYNIKKVRCEGKLAYFNDSVFPEFDFSGSPEELFRQIIDCHNSQVMPFQQIHPGSVTVIDSNDYIVRSSESAMNTWKALKEKCFQSSLSGHLQLRYEEDGDYLDWLADYTKESKQEICFGKNMLELLIDTSAEETYTAIRPQGAKIAEGEEDGRRIGIADVNDGIDYLIDEDRASEVGIIFADPEESIWEDVTLPENLKKKAAEKLKSGVKLRETVEVKAVDLSLTDSQTEALGVCTYVQVVSELHGIREKYLLSKAELSIDSPENSRFTLGRIRETLTERTRRRQQEQQEIVRQVTEQIPQRVSELDNDASYVPAPEMEQKVEEKVTEIIENSSTINPTIEVKTDTDTKYVLYIRSAAGEILTPNLKGVDGQDGEPGQDGADGKPGRDGIDGESAYEIAVRHGYEGTEEQWTADMHKRELPEGKEGYILQFVSGAWTATDVLGQLDSLTNEILGE